MISKKIIIIILTIISFFVVIGLITTYIIVSWIPTVDDTPLSCEELFPDMIFESNQECREYRSQEIQKAIDARNEP